MKAAPAYAALGYVSLGLDLDSIRFGRQARPGEHVDSGLAAFRRSEFATLDKMRQKHKTRLGRFITSPRRLADLSLFRHNITSHASFLGAKTPCCVGTDPEKCAKNVSLSKYYSHLSRKREK